MGAKSRRKGDNYELDVLHWLEGEGVGGLHKAPRGSKIGDIIGLGTIECKNQAQLRLAAAVDQMQQEMVAAGTEIGVVIHKRKGVGNVANHFATMPVWLWLRLLDRAGYLG